LDEDINTIKEGVESLLEACRKDGIEVNREKTKCMVMSRYKIRDEIGVY